jgi:hypothetical protein
MLWNPTKQLHFHPTEEQEISTQCMLEMNRVIPPKFIFRSFSRNVSFDDFHFGTWKANHINTIDKTLKTSDGQQLVSSKAQHN